MNEATTVLIKDTPVWMAEENDSNSTEVLMNETEVLEIGTEVLMNETEVLEIGTEVLIDETEVLNYGTVVLAQDIGTTVLTATTELETENDTKPQAIEFKIVKDIKITHTNEVI
jgi:3D (Asp-Asp-Asp) domain-containing protein